MFAPFLAFALLLVIDSLEVVAAVAVQFFVVQLLLADSLGFQGELF